MKKNSQEKLKTNKYKPNKLLGQNFLVSRRVSEKIISAADLKPDDVVLEAGPGLGVLTLELAKKAKKVIAVEKDVSYYGRLKEILTDKKISNIELICGDILKFRAEEYINSAAGYKIVANIPYYITSRFFRKFLSEEKLKPKEMIVTIQKEVAKRITAEPPDMNMLALSVQIYGKPEIVAPIPKESFRPRPRVESAIIKISVITEDFFTKNGVDEKKFFLIAKTAFSQKRKKIGGSLEKIFGSKTSARESIKKAGINPNLRPQNLTANDWVKIAICPKTNG